MKRIWAVLVLFMAGCGTAGRAPKADHPTFAPAPEFYSSESGAGFAPSSAPASATRDGRAEASSEPAPSLRDSSSSRRNERPGLGTEFGERRTSQVYDVSFVRDSGRPFSLVTLNYNDQRGVDNLVALAERRGDRYGRDASGAVTVSVRGSDGEFLNAVHTGDRTFVIGHEGERYSIVLQNHTGQRFEAVGTVDGLDVISGKSGTLENRGYVMMPYATLEIEGFRTSTADVAAFRFAKVADSYAAQTGSARNVGVIGVALFAERGSPFVPDHDTRLRDSATPFPADPRFARPPSRY